MDDDDFLWECALLERNGDSTHFMVPGILDEPKNFLKMDPTPLESYTTSRPCRADEVLESIVLSISVTEIRGNGVLDTIGGEIWEACLLLSAYILLHPQSFMMSSVLELGSGLGLPGLLVAELQSLIHCQFGREVCLSDNDPRCVESLVQLIQRRYDISVHEDCRMSLTDSDLIRKGSCRNSLSVIDLDWSSYVPTSSSSSSSAVLTEDFTEHEELDILTCAATHFKLDHKLVDRGRFEVLMGSALCYSPYHICLADTLKHFLEGSCEEIVIIQIGDRAGFSQLLERLTFLHIQYTIEEVSEEIYNTAQLIEQNQFISSDTTSVSKERNCSSSVTPTCDEGEVRTKKKFHFPSHLVQAAIGACRSVSSSEIASSDDSFAHDTSTVRSCAPYNVAEDTLLHDTTVSFPVTRNLVKTDRRSFIILKIKK